MKPPGLRSRIQRPPGGFVTRTYQIGAGTVRSIDQLAYNLNVCQSDLVSYLLESAIKQVENGQLNIPTVNLDVRTINHAY